MKIIFESVVHLLSHIQKCFVKDYNTRSQTNRIYVIADQVNVYNGVKTKDGRSFCRSLY